MPARIITGDSRIALGSLPRDHFHCVVTSPPYWGLRDYEHPDQLGCEPTLEEHVEALVRVFRDIRRVLRHDGTVWLNYGDAYASDSNGWRSRNPKEAKAFSPHNIGERVRPAQLKPKDLMGLPWRIALALQDDGWWLRADCIWNKPNAMPGSAQDRPSVAHEYVFLLAKSELYFYDLDAVRQPAKSGSRCRRQSEPVP